MVLDRFSSGNPIGWIFRAEQYFTYLGFSKNDWLPLASFYLDGAALNWFQWLHRNKQFYDWKHFTEKLTLHFRNDSTMIHNDLNTALDLMRKLDEKFSYMLSKLDNVQRSLSTCSQSAVVDLELSDADSSLDDEGDSNLPVAVTSLPVCKTLVSDIVDPVNSSHISDNLILEIDVTVKGLSTTSEDQVFDGISQRAGQTFHEFSIVDDDVEVIGPVLNKDLESKSEVCRNTNHVLAPYGLTLKIGDGKGTVLTYRDGEKSSPDTCQLFDICSQKAGLSLVANDMVDSLSAMSDPLILDGIRSKKKYISIHFPFDPGEPIHPPILFESLNVHLDKSQFLYITMYSGIFTLYSAMEVPILVLRVVANVFRVCSGVTGDHLFNKMSPSEASYDVFSTRWFSKNKENALTGVTIRLGLILLYDVDYGLASINKYLSHINVSNFPHAPWGKLEILSHQKSFVEPEIELPLPFMDQNDIEKRLLIMTNSDDLHIDKRVQHSFRHFIPFPGPHIIFMANISIMKTKFPDFHFNGIFELLCASWTLDMFLWLQILLYFANTINEYICGVSGLAVREHKEAKSNILLSHLGILQYFHEEIDKIMQASTTLFEAIRDHVAAVTCYGTCLMNLLGRTLLRRFLGQQSSFVQYVKDPKHVKNFFDYVRLWAFDNDVDDVRIDYSNLKDKVLNGDGGIVMNGPNPILTKQPNTTLSGYVWDPG